MTKKRSESTVSTWQRRVISRHNNIPLMHQHSLEQISFLEKFCTEKIANNTLTIQMAVPILSELAQHGSSVFSRLDDYLDFLSHNNGLTEYRDTLRELHTTTHKIGTDALKSFDKDVVKRLHHPRVPVYYGNQNNNRRLAVVFTTSYNEDSFVSAEVCV